MVKGKLVSGGNKFRDERGHTFPVEGLGKGITRDQAAIRKNNYEVDVTLVPDKISSGSSIPQTVARLNRKFTKKIQIS